ncbi:molybdate ABC transporter substrate-binding protein [Oryzomonas japonica]|uniref:Molybdate ABC transporter substrate-binding protein n=2 Tax=Oryzomonas japonica TaxID=2603858 RepID=A0A7J4ZRP9_9BACT|nr:molybdate ABC transporter substrate-binding protein [Oryzomonas japonica]
MMNRIVSTLVVALACLLPVTALAGEINLFVAASMREVVNELSADFAVKNSGVTFKKNYGASGALAKQIENGAPADIFISANVEWMDYMKKKKLADDRSVATFAYNSLVFAGRPGVKAASLHDVTKLEKIAIGSPKSVPAGEYATEAFRKAGIDKQLEKKLVMAKDVRECLLYADRGEVDGAFVYKTDALQVAKSAKILFTVPQQYYPRVTYPMALTVTGGKKAEAAGFYRFLQSAEAKAVLAKHGFLVK